MFVKDNKYFHSETNVIACFKPVLEFGEPIIYEPKYPLFMPVHYNIQKFYVTVTDENNNLIDFNCAPITIILEAH
jgi:hypothetical protein